MVEKNVVGIDFGTSTSVVRVKSYNVQTKDGSEKWSSLDSNDMMTYNVTFNSGQVMVPTLIQKVNNSTANNVTYFGYDAAVHKKGEKIHQNFKIELEGEQKETARELTQEYLGYLYESYRLQREGGYLGTPSSEEKTIISYPVKWSEETRSFMVNAAKKAGFKNVEGMDEAQAAITAVITISGDMLKRKNYIAKDTPMNIMLIDMGAGTTDIVICRYTPGDNPKNEILCTWPNEGDILFGGRELDEILQRYILEKIPEEGRDKFAKRIGINEYKAWKEYTVSGSLERNESVTSFDHGEVILELLELEMDDFSLDRAAFEKYAKEYLNQFPKLVNGSIQACVKSGKLKGSSHIDLVILTGGHSRWYFVKEMLLGMGNKICLEKIKVDNGRLISISKPQETVALGLVYSKLPQNLNSALSNVAKKNPDAVQTNDKAEKKNAVESDISDKTPDESTSTESLKANDDSIQNKKYDKTSVTVSNRMLPDEEKEFFKIVSDTCNKCSSRLSPTNNLLVFRKTLHISDGVKIYGMYDTSFFRRGKNGVAICSDGIHICPLFESDTFIVPWAEFLLKEKPTLRNGTTYLGIAYNGIPIYQILRYELKQTAFYTKLLMNLEMASDANAKFLDPITIDAADLDAEPYAVFRYYTTPIEEFLNKYNEYFKEHNIVNEKEYWLHIDCSSTKKMDEDFAKHVKDFAKEWLDYAYSDMLDYTNDKDAMFIKIICSIPAEDILFFARHTQNNGLVLCTSGIYSVIESAHYYTPWDMFLLMDITQSEDGDARIGSLRPLAKKTEKVNAPKLLKLLQDHLKKTQYYEYLKQQAAQQSQHITELTENEMRMYYLLRVGGCNHIRVAEHTNNRNHIFGFNDLNDEILDICLG